MGLVKPLLTKVNDRLSSYIGIYAIDFMYIFCLGAYNFTSLFLQ